MMDTNELKPCPFCGVIPYRSGQMAIHDCLAVNGAMVIETIDRWQRRPLEDAQAAEIAALTELATTQSKNLDYGSRVIRDLNNANHELRKDNAALTARVERMRAALIDIRHGASIHPAQAEKLYREIATDAISADNAAGGDK